MLPLKMLEIGTKLNVEADQSPPLSLSQHCETSTKSMSLYMSRWDGIERVLRKLDGLVPTSRQHDLTFVVAGMISPGLVNGPSSDSQSSTKVTWCTTFKDHLTLYLLLTVALNACIAKGQQTTAEDLLNSPSNLNLRRDRANMLLDSNSCILYLVGETTLPESEVSRTLSEGIFRRMVAAHKSGYLDHTQQRTL